ncbi:hypothetical protein ACQP3L_37815, partial [Escherichia coli]
VLSAEWKGPGGRKGADLEGDSRRPMMEGHKEERAQMSFELIDCGLRLGIEMSKMSPGWA